MSETRLAKGREGKGGKGGKGGEQRRRWSSVRTTVKATRTVKIHVSMRTVSGDFLLALFALIIFSLSLPVAVCSSLRMTAIRELNGLTHNGRPQKKSTTAKCHELSTRKRRGERAGEVEKETARKYVWGQMLKRVSLCN